MFFCNHNNLQVNFIIFNNNPQDLSRLFQVDGDKFRLATHVMASRVCGVTSKLLDE